MKKFEWKLERERDGNKVLKRILANGFWPIRLELANQKFKK